MAEPFATKDDVQARYPSDAALLCADETTREPDWARFDAALADVSMEIRIILQARYTSAQLNDLDAESLWRLKLFFDRHAMYRVAVTFARSTEEIKTRYDIAVTRLEGVASGKKGALTFNSSGSGSVDGAPTTGSPGEADRRRAAAPVLARLDEGLVMDFGVKIDVDKHDLAAINALVTGLSDFDAAPLVEEIVQLGENQTRKRIESGGPGPDGEAWPPNLEGTAILFRTGRHLHDLSSSSSGTSGEWEASWEFAHVHQDGCSHRTEERRSAILHARRQARLRQKVTIRTAFRRRVGRMLKKSRSLSLITSEGSCRDDALLRRAPRQCPCQGTARRHRCEA
jgi:phage gp36-like protein